MTSVNIGISHNNDLVISSFGDVKIFPADSCSQCSDQGSNFIIGKHFVKPSFFHIQDLSLWRKKRLVFAVTPLFGRASRRVTLHQE